jgi:Tfp pilus assembly protein FimT
MATRLSMQPLRALPLPSTAAHSLIELLVCVAIVAILTSISLVYYQGALDQADLKFVGPALARQLNELRTGAAERASSITVEFEIGTSHYKVTERKAGTITESAVDMKESGLLRRSHTFRRFEWPDGSETPATFTFIGTTPPQGGILYIGTALAEARIRIGGSHVISELQP